MPSLQEAKAVHLVGAGGIGLSAIGKMLRRHGTRVTGSDVRANESTADLVGLGAEIWIGHAAANIPGDAGLIIYSDAVPEDNPERAAAAARGIPQMSYFEALGELTRSRETVAVSGTNGKSTTTAMLGLILAEAGRDPAVVVGSRVAAFPDGNLRLGKGPFVVEACEYRANFLHLSPKAIVLTDVKEDHLDYFRDLDHIKETFRQYLSRLPATGLLVWNADDAVSLDLPHPAWNAGYGFGEEADYRISKRSIGDGRQSFRVTARGRDLGEFTLAVPGRFNVMNAVAALAAALELGADLEAARRALAAFPGLWRRFEQVGEKNGVTVVSDYAHHPEAVAGTIEAARELYRGRRLVVCFQPHQRHRTKKLFGGFVESLGGADVVVLPEIFDPVGRADEAVSVTSLELVQAAIAADLGTGRQRPVIAAGTAADALKTVRAVVRRGDVLLVMGAGDIDRVARQFVAE